MGSIGITTYGFNIQNREDKQRYNLNRIGGVGFIELFTGFISENCTQYINDVELEKVFKIEDYENDSFVDNGSKLFDYYIGRIKTGAYGNESEIVNAVTGDVKFNKEFEDADVMPFFFLIAVPIGDVDSGIIILQSNGIFGIKTIFQKKLSEYLKLVDNNYELTIGNIAPSAYIDRYLSEGVLQKVRFIRYNIPNDRGEQIGINNGVEESYEEYVVHKPIGFLTKKGREIRQCINGQRAVNHIIRIEGFDYDNVKLDFKMGRKSKTINLSNIDNLSLSEDITDQVDLIGGHPTSESIRPVLVDTATGYLEEIGLIVRGD